ncbi:MAG: hypothetical protein WDZ49_03585 [Litorilinea sp.]
MRPQIYAWLLGLLAFAFFLRVVGQILVALDLAPFLPPMHAWYSGLVPYPLLLGSQIAILLLQVMISRDLGRGRGFFARPRRGFGRFLRGFGVVYLVVMILRYILTMLWFPELRWFTGIIPIFFHWVLATYVLVWSSYHRRAERL